MYSAVTFFRCSGQVYNSLCQRFSEFSIPKLIKIGLFLTGLYKNNEWMAFFSGRQCIIAGIEWTSGVTTFLGRFIFLRKPLHYCVTSTNSFSVTICSVAWAYARHILL